MLLLTLAVVLGTTTAHYHQPDGESNVVRRKREAYDFMLSKSTVPSHYSVSLTPYVEGNFKFDGETKITLRVQETTNYIVLHAKNLDIEESNTILITESREVNRPLKHEYDNVFDFLTLSFENSLVPGICELQIKYTGNLNTYPRGIYGAAYQNEKADIVWVVATKFRTSYARTAFPCWDEPSFKATFDISIKHYPNYTAMSNMPIENQSGLDVDGMLWTNFQRTPVMSTNAVGFVLTNYVLSPSTNGIFKIWAPKESMPYVDYALEISEKATKIMEEYTKIPIMVPKVDLVVLPIDSRQITENWGLALYAKDAIMYDDIFNPLKSEGRKVINVIHQISHIWFGHLVSPAYWNYIWMSEGFATYFSYCIANKIFPEWRLSDTYGGQNMPQLFKKDSKPTIPLNQKFVHLPKIQSDFSSWIMSQKAGAILRMTVHTLSEKIFRQGILTYLNDHAYKSVTPNHLSEVLQSALDESDVPHDQFSVKDFLDTWENQAGYPFVNVTRDYNTGETQLTQQVYNSHDTSNHDSSARWWIPINFATQSNPDFSQTTPKIWMKPQDEVTTIEGVDRNDWIILNVQETGFYRVNYDKINWQRIARYLKSDDYTNIHVVNRATLISNAYNLLLIKEIDPIVFFELISYLEYEKDTIPWDCAIEILDAIHPFIMTLERESLFRRRILHLMNKIIADVGFEEKSDDDRGMKLIRPKIRKIACRYGHPDCSISDEKITMYLESVENMNTLTPEHLWPVCIGLRKAGDAAWEKVFSLYKEHGGIRELICLSCTNNATLLEKFFDLMAAEDSIISRADFVDLALSIMYLHPTHIDIALDYFIKNKEKLKDLIRTPFFTRGIYTHDQFQKIIQNFPLNTTEEQKVLANEEANILVWENAASKIANWLQGREIRNQE